MGIGAGALENGSAHEKFQRLSQEILEHRWAFYPPAASKLGLHQYDGVLPDFSQGAVRRRSLEILGGMDLLVAIDPKHLSAQERLDHQLLQLALEKEQFDLADLRILETDPMKQLGYLNVTNYIQRGYAPLPDRVGSLAKLLSQVPDFLSTMRGSLREELGRPVLDASIDSYEGMSRFYREDLEKLASVLTDKAELGSLNKARERAARAVDDFVAVLRDRLQRASPEFAIGPELYRKMLRYGEMVDIPLSRLLQVGQADLERNLEKLSEVAAQIDPAKPVRELIDAIGKEHPSAQKLIHEAGRILEEIRQFIIDQRLLTLPSEQRCQVMETPSFMRWAFAAMDTPGLLERQATESYYYVTPVEAHWTEKQ